MKEKIKSPSLADSAGSSDVHPADQPLEHVLQRLPSQYRAEILKQYDLPSVKISIFDILRYATNLEFAMQIIGTICAIAAGTPLTEFVTDT
jgi:hypothetical protein